jgi:hypothetical protein
VSLGILACVLFIFDILSKQNNLSLVELAWIFICRLDTNTFDYQMS